MLVFQNVEPLIRLEILWSTTMAASIRWRLRPSTIEHHSQYSGSG